MSRPLIDVEVEDEAWTRALPDAVALVQQAAEAALSFDSSPAEREEIQITILLTSDAEVRALNARFRGHDKATNVLSFPAGERAGDHLGDLALASGVCLQEADEQGKPLAHHLMHLVVHGVLHLRGHDHEIEAEGDAMEALERCILARLGVPDPYAAETASPAEARRAV